MIKNPQGLLYNSPNRFRRSDFLLLRIILLGNLSMIIIHIALCPLTDFFITFWIQSPTFHYKVKFVLMTLIRLPFLITACLVVLETTPICLNTVKELKHNLNHLLTLLPNKFGFDIYTSNYLIRIKIVLPTNSSFCHYSQ